jgi:hypothetical protein
MKKGHSGKSYHVDREKRRKKKAKKKARKIKDPLLRAVALALEED